MSDDDWFERALRDRDDDSEGRTDDDETDAADARRPVGEGDPDAAGAEPPSGAVDGATREGDAGDRSDTTGATDDGREGSSTDAGDGEAEDDPFGGRADDAPRQSDGASASPFDEDFSEAFANAPDVDAGEAGAKRDPFGGGRGRQPSGDDPFGGGDEEFGFGGGGAPPDGPPEFDEEDFDSDIERIDLGIEGLDEMILGGVPRRSLVVAVGSAGTGKTTFGLQFLNHALERDENAVYITLEESRTRILDTAEEKGWSFREYEAEDRLVVVDLDPIEMANSLGSIQNDLPRLVDSFGADRLVLDSVSLLEMMYDSTQKRRSQVFNFTRSLKDAGVTTMLTSEASTDNPYVSRHGIVEYLADAVFVLQYVRPSDFRETRLAIEIQKIRDANHSRETKPYELTSEGISVYGRANIF
jgi:KaiC domain protein